MATTLSLLMLIIMVTVLIIREIRRTSYFSVSVVKVVQLHTPVYVMTVILDGIVIPHHITVIMDIM